MHYAPMPEFNGADIRRFWSYVDQRTPDECWNWKKSQFTGGYGQFKCARANLKTHRVAYFLYYHVDPRELLVCHTCDNPSCCNPNHLFLGTEIDNMEDMLTKGRHMSASGALHGSKSHPEKWYKGEQCPWAKLTEQQVRSIRKTYASREASQAEIAKRYGIARRTVGAIIRGSSWSLVAESDGLGNLSDPKRLNPRGEKVGTSKLTEEQVRELRAAYIPGVVTCKMLAPRYGVSTETVRHAVVGRSWKHVK